MPFYMFDYEFDDVDCIINTSPSKVIFLFFLFCYALDYNAILLVNKSLYIG